MKKPIFKKGKKYTFRDYFNFPQPIKEVVSALGYAFVIKPLDLPILENIELNEIKNLNRKFYKILPKVSLTSESARKNLLISPILFELIASTDANMDMEYPIKINHLLGGSLDYFIQAKQDIIVVEAKKGEIDRGFTQLAAELIALDQYEDKNFSDILYGIVSIGDMWRFGLLERKTKTVIKDIHSYRIPEDTEKLFMILQGIVQGIS